MGLVYNFIMPADLADLAARRRAKYCPDRGTAEFLIRRWGGGDESTGMRDPARLENASKLIRSDEQTCAKISMRVRARVRVYACVRACVCVTHDQYTRRVASRRIASYPLERKSIPRRR